MLKGWDLTDLGKPGANPWLSCGYVLSALEG